MDKGTHTPGPWSVGFEKPSLERGIEIPRHILGADRKIIVTFNAANPRKGEEKRANASLISAAPDLLEALTLARTFMVDFEGLPETDAHNPLRIVDAAIAKARGNAPENKEFRP